ncbi:MAG: M3 family oligoendopeptidase [Sphingobacteriales bacterium]|nr:MAG: M3 family oligoendopeptidase [Sphingobacteriales bacterium]
MHNPYIFTAETVTKAFFDESIYGPLLFYLTFRPFYKDLAEREIHSDTELKKWLADRNELDSYLGEDAAWRYINYTRNTEDSTVKENYLFFINEIKPKIAPYSNTLDKKLVDSPFINLLEDKAYHIYLRSTQTEIELYREENINLFVQIEEKAQQYAEIQSQMSISYNGEEFTLQQAAKFLKDADRNVRKEVYDKIVERRAQDVDKLDQLYTELVSLRHEVAKNAGFENYRDYKFKALGRFDYTIEDVFSFHQSVREEIVPLASHLLEIKRKELGVETLKPYDLDGEPEGQKPLEPYKTSRELLDKCIETFSNLHPALGKYLQIMDEKGLLDLDSRKGKAPGGYNYPLDESGVAFIFMNASGKFRDMVTMMHEGGHAVHSFLTRNLHLSAFKHAPSEVSELASMSMELITMDYWNHFFSDEKDLIRAKKEQLEGVIESLPWIATVDKFQNWVYTHPSHTIDERHDAWQEIFMEFHPEGVDWSGYEKNVRIGWQRQLHIYEVPFYYIEYGIAQLGALAVWKNYKENPEKGLTHYLEALKLGYTRSVPEIYEAAGIKFDFSLSYIQQLASFLKSELQALEK